jgi:hypothetical protein
VTYVHHCGILLATLYEFTVVDIRVPILIHTPEYLVHTLGSQINACLAGKRETDLLRCFFVLGELQHLASHLVNSLYYGEHLLVGYDAILVDVV